MHPEQKRVKINSAENHFQILFWFSGNRSLFGQSGAVAPLVNYLSSSNLVHPGAKPTTSKFLAATPALY
jgi:hypothetical protein